MSTLSEDAKATLLLTGRFGDKDRSNAKPLSPSEWGQFAGWLQARGLSPKDLLATHSHQLLAGWSSNKVTADRLDQLLDRGMAMSLSLEKWHSAGVWVMTRSDRDYPRMLKRRLRESSPPVLFGCGDRAVINKGGIAVVGSRNADDAALKETRALAAVAASEGVSIVSGGARGVDEAAMTAAVEAQGTASGILANSLLKTSMLYVRQAAAVGHEALVDLGAAWLPCPSTSARALLSAESSQKQGLSSDTRTDCSSVSESKACDFSTNDPSPEPAASRVVSPRSDPSAKRLYGVFAEVLSDELKSGPLTAAKLAERLDLPKSLADKWIRAAIDDGLVERIPLHTNRVSAAVI